MRAGKLLGDNTGSVTILAIGIMMFLGIILSGVLPMITQEVRSGTVNRDVVEAQYAAEAGLKRAIAAMEAGDNTWDWLGAARDFTSVAGKTYSVSFVTAGVCKAGRVYQAAPATGSAPASGWYCLQSVGTVNGASKTVSVAVELATMPAVLSSGIFGSASIRMDSNSQVVGPAGTNGSITMANSATITGMATAVSGISATPAQIPTANQNLIASTLAVPTFSIAFTAPAVPTAPAILSSVNWPLGDWSVNNTASPLAAGNYLANKSEGLKSDQSTITIQGNTNIYVTNGFSMYNSTWTTGNNTIVDVLGGGMSLTGNAKITSGTNSTYYIRDGLYVDNLLGLGSNSVVYAGQGIQLNSNSTMSVPGSATVHMANGNLIVGNNSVVSLGSVGNASTLYCKGSANISGATININGPTTKGSATKVYFTGDLDLNNSTVLNIAGNVEIYVTGKLQMTNTSKIFTANNSNLVLKLGGFVDLNNNAEIRSGTNSTIAMMIDDNVTFSNNTVIEKALVLATGNVELNNNSNITGAIISTGSEIYMTNSSIVTYDEETVKLVWNNISEQVVVSGGGTGGVGPVEWKSH